MAFFKSTFDIQVAIYQTIASSTLAGFRSDSVDIPLPATGKTIRGFEFDVSKWRSDTDDNNAFFVPTLWDPRISTLQIQSGIGDNEDLEVQEVNVVRFNNKNVWNPKVNHGYFYDQAEERYLFSDDSLTQYPLLGQVAISDLDNTVSGGNYLDLQFNPKPGIPILARSFRWDSDGLVFNTFESAHKKNQFSQLISDEVLLTQVSDEILWDNLDLTTIEFVLNTDSGIPRVVFNQQVVKPVGRSISDITSQEERDAMEFVGTTAGSDYEEFHLEFSPVDRTSDIQILLVSSGIPTMYTVVSGFQSGNTEEVMIDYDLSILKFGTTEEGGLPPSGSDIYAYYFRTLAFEYEPDKSRDYIEQAPADLNPVRHSQGNGFVFIEQKAAQDINSIALAAELDLISSNYYGPLYVGNDFTNVVATVLDKSGNLVDGIEVFFEITTSEPDATFGPNTEASAFTNANGQAKTLLNSPRTIDSLGGVTNNIMVWSGGSRLFIDDYFPPTSTETLYLFQVQVTDNILGIPKADLLDFYEDYIQEQGSDPTQVHGPLITWDIDNLGDMSWITGAYENFIKWEVVNRAVHNLVTPITYEPGDLTTGKKTVVAVLDSDAINPHTGTTPAFIPLQPVAYTTVASGTFVDFDQTLPAISSTVKSYLVIGPEKVTVQAHAFNPITGHRIDSNSIDLLIDISDSQTGVITVNSINSIPSGLLGNAYLYDQDGIELEEVEITTSGLLPLGWRIRSPGITLASTLDSVTFLDINPLAWESEQGATIGHSFEVI